MTTDDDRKALLGFLARTANRQVAEAQEKGELAAISMAVATEVLDEAAAVIKRLTDALDAIQALHEPVASPFAVYCPKCIEPWPCQTEQLIEVGRNGDATDA